LHLNLYETSDTYVFQLAIPGMTPENLDIQVLGTELSVKGKREVNTPENGTWIWQGINGGEFYQSFTLPAEVDSEHVQASYDYGILSVVLPKAEHVKPRNIKIEVHK